MIRRMTNRFKFILERLILRGAHYQLLVIAFLICLVSLLAGILAFSTTSTFKQYGDIALGVRQRGDKDDSAGGINLNPPRNFTFRLKDSDEVVVLTTYILR